jgi:hypothetical protein
MCMVRNQLGYMDRLQGLLSFREKDNSMCSGPVGMVNRKMAPLSYRILLFQKGNGIEKRQPY